jgi:hypothetical protein
MKQAWGKHYFFNGYGNKDRVSDYGTIKNFATALVTEIDMVAFGEPIVLHFATHDPSKGGYSLAQFIETSLIDGHFVDATGEIYISVFSCKDFDSDTVFAVIDSFFEVYDYNTDAFYRKAGDKGSFYDPFLAGE